MASLVKELDSDQTNGMKCEKVHKLTSIRNGEL